MSDQKQTKENETMNAAQVLVRCLENEGVEYVFGIPGEENLSQSAMSRAQLLWQMFTVN